MKDTNILIIKIGAIGDVVMALPMIEACQGRVTCICGKIVRPLIKAHEVIEVEEKKLLKGNIWELIKIWTKLGFRKFDLIIIAHRDWRYRLIPLFVRGEKRIFKPIPGEYHALTYLNMLEGNKQINAKAQRRKGAKKNYYF